MISGQAVEFRISHGLSWKLEGNHRGFAIGVWFSKLNDRGGKPQALVSMFPLTRACPILGTSLFFEFATAISLGYPKSLPNRFIGVPVSPRLPALVPLQHLRVVAGLPSRSIPLRQVKNRGYCPHFGRGKRICVVVQFHWSCSGEAASLLTFSKWWSYVSYVFLFSDLLINLHVSKPGRNPRRIDPALVGTPTVAEFRPSVSHAERSECFCLRCLDSQHSNLTGK